MMIHSPIIGAMAGTIMNTIITKLMIRAISRPACRSRISAMPAMRTAAAPSPMTKRDTSSMSSEGDTAATSDDRI